MCLLALIASGVPSRFSVALKDTPAGVFASLSSFCEHTQILAFEGFEIQLLN